MPFSCCKRKIRVDNMPNSKSKSTLSTKAKHKSTDKDSFFVITTIFNPVSFQSRYDLYHGFASHMHETGAQLVTVECIFPELGQYDFKVTNSENPFHIQLKSKSVYWVKENLINIAVSRLPPYAKWVCWLDADITFHEQNWIDLTIEKLKEYTIVQVFEKCKFIGPLPDEKVLRSDYSFGYSVIHGKPIDQKRYDEWYPHPGYGWGTSVDAFRTMKGLPDFDILGSADLHFAFSLLNKVSNVIEKDLNPSYAQLILNHSAQTFALLSELNRTGTTGVSVGYVPMTIRHHWHGSSENRQYVDRWKIPIAHKFDFNVDMHRLDNGLYEFASWKASMQIDIIDHFRMRKEDSKEVKSQFSRKDSSDDRRFHDDNVLIAQLGSHEIDDDDDDDEFCNRPWPPGHSDCPYHTNRDCSTQHHQIDGGYSNNYDGIIATTSYY